MVCSRYIPVSRLLLWMCTANNLCLGSYVIVDEAYCIKSGESSLAQVIRLFNSRNRLLITGTTCVWEGGNCMLHGIIGKSIGG